MRISMIVFQIKGLQCSEARKADMGVFEGGVAPSMKVKKQK